MEQFDYTTFDRQLQNFSAMANAFISGWDDVMTLEINIDLKSLCLKASRLCAMADTDYALQQQDLAHLRTQRNKEWEAIFNKLLRDDLTPLLRRAMDTTRRTGRLDGHTSPMFPCEMSTVLPRLTLLLAESESSNDNYDWNKTVQHTLDAEKLFHKVIKPTKYPGMDYRERFWMLYELFALSCYLLFHFRRLVQYCQTDVPTEDAGARLRDIIRIYAQSTAGSNELQRFWQALRFDNNGELPLGLLQETQKALRNQVPPYLQLCFMQHIRDLDKLALSLIGINITPSDYTALVDALAKWQMLEHEIQLLLHPEDTEDVLWNEVFVGVHNNCHIDLSDLRNRIGRMLKYVTRKNHWFCVWSVLWYRGYLADKSHGAFARQMMHSDWFGCERGVLSFSADTLNEYAGYFTERQYPIWNQADFINYRDTHNKKKWGDALCKNFLALCYQMDEEFNSVG